MEEQLKRIEEKVDKNTKGIDKIRDNHLPHIYEKLGKVSGQNYVLIALSLAIIGALIKLAL